MDFSSLLQFIVYIVISLFFGLCSIYFWVRVYRDVQKGSMAWLLLALTSVFLITTSIFPSIAIVHPRNFELQYLSLIFLTFWSSIYTCTFAAAGFLVFRAFRTIPKENIGEYLLEGMVFKTPKSDEVSGLLGSSTLLEYTTHSRYEDGVIELTLRMFGELRNVILISNEPRASTYREKLVDIVDVGAMKFVEILTNGDEITIEEDIVIVPITTLDDQFLDLFDKLPEGVRIIFEPLSHLILSHGEEETYKLVSKMVEKFSHQRLDLVAMINRDAHDDKTLSQFRGLFINHAELTSEKIKVIKGKKEEYIRYMVGEKFFLNA